MMDRLADECAIQIQLKLRVLTILCAVLCCAVLPRHHRLGATAGSQLQATPASGRACSCWQQQRQLTRPRLTLPALYTSSY
jgi:hypothetical protein